VTGRITIRLGPAVRTPVADLTGSDAVTADGFGDSVAISGTTIVVGAPRHLHWAGRAYVFARVAGGWRQSAELMGSDTLAGDDFGSSVAMSGGIIVVGAPGHARSAGRVYVFTRSARGWRQSAELTGSGIAAGDNFGSTVAASDGTIVVGDRANRSGGRAYAFSRTSGSWSQSAEITGFARPYTAVAISGATIVVASSGGAAHTCRTASCRYTYNSGAYTYVERAGGWRRASRLDAPGPGYFLNAAMSASTIVITNENPGCGTGQADVFTAAGRAWKLAATLIGGGCFGASVAVSGSTVAVGSNAWPAASVFTRTAGRWHQSAVLADPSRLTNQQAFGWPIAISGQTVVLARISDRRGIVYLYRL
jgi:hypothetical protein